MAQSHKQYASPELLLDHLSNDESSMESQRGTRGFILCDSAFRSVSAPVAYHELLNRWPVHWVDAGERCKSLEKAQDAWSWLEASGAGRFDTLIIIGGGTTTDLGAFVASTYKRGVNFILIPTTLLGMVDAAIGGKNGLNLNGIKNAIGTFSEPSEVRIDVNWLHTLPRRGILNGWMELSKHALIRDKALWSEMQTLGPHDSGIDWSRFVQEGNAIKKEIVEIDFHEQGERKQLNFGHTVGHALESAAAEANIALDHGFAVGVGMISALHWSVLNADKITDQESLKEASETLKRWLKSESESAPFNWCVKQSPEHLWGFMLKDKKNKANTVLDVRLHEIGAAKWDCPIAENDFEIIWMSAF